MAENIDLPSIEPKFDIFVEGWSFGHTASDGISTDDVLLRTDQLVQSAEKNIKTGGQIIFIESLGTNVDSPFAPNERLGHFYRSLVDRHGFTQSTIRTDYKFESNDEAVRVMGFFFGEKSIQAIKNRRTNTIPEWTGLWTRDRVVG